MRWGVVVLAVWLVLNMAAALVYWSLARVFHWPVVPGFVLLWLCFWIVPRWIIAWDWARGARLLRLKRYQESKTHSERFLRDMADWPWALAWMRANLRRRGRHPVATVLCNVGFAELGMKDFEAAKARFQAAIAQDAWDPRPYYGMGMVALECDEIDDVMGWLEQARERGGGKELIGKALRVTRMKLEARYGPVKGAKAPPLARLGGRRDAEGARFRVDLLNDETTPMQFVVDLLKEVFYKSHEEAVIIMLETHRRGTGVCGVFGQEEAAAKAAEVARRAEAGGFALRCAVVAVV